MLELPRINGGSVIWGVDAAASAEVTLLMTSAEVEVARERTVPETVIAGPPAISVCVPTRYWLAELAAMVEPPIANGGLLVCGGEIAGASTVMPLTRIVEAKVAMEMVVPNTVTA